jgi:pyruvate kinase
MSHHRNAGLGLKGHQQAGCKQSGRVSRALCEAAAFAADEMNTRIIAVFTESGLMARRLASLRPEQRIIALTSSREVINELSLIWGVETVIADRSNSTEQLLKFGEQALLQADLVDLGETIVIMAGRLSGLGLSGSVTLYGRGRYSRNGVGTAAKPSDNPYPKSKLAAAYTN